MTFGKYLKEARINKGLTQKDISESLRWSSSQMISEVERGSVYLSKDSLKKVCRILDLDFDTALRRMVFEKYDIK